MGSSHSTDAQKAKQEYDAFVKVFYDYCKCDLKPFPFLAAADSNDLRRRVLERYCKCSARKKDMPAATKKRLASFLACENPPDKKLSCWGPDFDCHQCCRTGTSSTGNPCFTKDTPFDKCCDPAVFAPLPAKKQ